MATVFSDYLFFVQFGPAVLKSVAVLAIDLADKDMRIIFASQLLEEMFGYGPDELRDRSLDDLLRPEDREAHHRHFVNFQYSSYTRTMNKGIWVDGVKKNGERFKIQVSLTVQPVGKTECVIACVADVTNAFEHRRPDPTGRPDSA